MARDDRMKTLRRGGEISLLRRSRGRTASELGGAIDDGGPPTVFTSATNPELEQDPSRGGQAPGRTLRQDLSATRGRTEVGPISDPGGGAGRVRPVAPTLSRRELEEQRRRGRIDASFARTSLRRQIGPISSRGPTRSQLAVLSSAPTAGEFTSQRIADIIAASQPNAAQSEAQERGLLRLESDRRFALEAQGLEQRGQIAQQESADRRYVADQNLQGQGLRTEATLQAANLRNQPNTAERAAAREDQGRQILDSMGLASKTKAKALGTKDPEEQARTMGNHFNAMIRNTDWEALPEALQDEQVLMNLAALDASFSEQERGKWFGGGKSGRAVSYNELFDRMQDFVLGGETARIFGASTVRSGGGEFKIGNLTSQQQKIYREFATSVRDAILADDSAAGRQQQLQLAENEAREEQKKIEGLLGANFWRTSGVGRGARRSMAEGEELTPLEVDSAVYRLMKEDGVEFDSGDRGVAEASASSRREQHAMIARSSPRYKAYKQEAERLINLYEIVSSNNPEAYLSYIMAQRSGTAERQERVYGLR